MEGLAQSFQKNINVFEIHFEEMPYAKHKINSF